MECGGLTSCDTANSASPGVCWWWWTTTTQNKHPAMERCEQLVVVDAILCYVQSQIGVVRIEDIANILCICYTWMDLRRSLCLLSKCTDNFIVPYFETDDINDAQHRYAAEVINHFERAHDLHPDLPTFAVTQIRDLPPRASSEMRPAILSENVLGRLMEEISEIRTDVNRLKGLDRAAPQPDDSFLALVTEKSFGCEPSHEKQGTAENESQAAPVVAEGVSDGIQGEASVTYKENPDMAKEVTDCDKQRKRKKKMKTKPKKKAQAEPKKKDERIEKSLEEEIAEAERKEVEIADAERKEQVVTEMEKKEEDPKKTPSPNDTWREVLRRRGRMPEGAAGAAQLYLGGCSGGYSYQQLSGFLRHLGFRRVRCWRLSGGSATDRRTSFKIQVPEEDVERLLGLPYWREHGLRVRKFYCELPSQATGPVAFKQ